MPQPHESDTSADPHGRQAKRPTGIPAQGWKEALWRVYGEMGDDRVTLVAAGVTYYLLLALVPGLSALVSVYGLFADPASVTGHVENLQGVLPGGALQVLQDQMQRLAAKGGTTLGLTLLISLAISLWSANAGVKALFEAMNVAYDEREKRSFIKLNAVSLLFTLATIVAALMMIGLVVALPLGLKLFNLGDAVEWLIGLVSLAAVIAVFSFGVAALYRWGPSRATPQWQWITPGSILTLVVTAIVSLLFSWYTANFGSYDATYGSLGALIGFLTWIWLTMIILIVGGELNSELEHQTSRDSTTGAPKPRGSRGARMADEVAGVEDHSEDRLRRRPARHERLSLGKLAVALPAALIFAWARKRGKRS